MLVLDEQVIKRLLKERFGRIGSIPRTSWPLPSEPVNRTTIYRWFRSGTIPSPELFYGLAGALEVDPFILLKPAGELSFAELCQQIGDTSWSLGPPRHFRRLLFLKDILEGKIEWPSSDWASRYFRRKWNRHVFTHNTKNGSNYYGRFAIEFQGSTNDKVWHFAWRNVRRRNWRPYGCVKGSESRLNLFCYDGLVDEDCSQDDHQPFVVETWFGPGNADFCIASLHDFTANLVSAKSPELRTVRFSVEI